MADIYKKISDVMNDIDAISKNRKNTQGNGYNFRGIDDVYNELHSVLSKHHVFTVPEVLEERTEERVSKSGGNLIYRILKIKYTFFTEDGSSVASIVIGEAMDSGDKAANKAMSVAHKYCLLQVFAIPTEEEKDPEVETHEPLPKKEVVTKHYISEAQLKLLNTEISKREIDRDKLKTFLKVDSLKDVTTAEFELVLENVRKKPIRQREPGEEIE